MSARPFAIRNPHKSSAARHRRVTGLGRITPRDVRPRLMWRQRSFLPTTDRLDTRAKPSMTCVAIRVDRAWPGHPRLCPRRIGWIRGMKARKTTGRCSNTLNRLADAGSQKKSHKRRPDSNPDGPNPMNLPTPSLGSFVVDGASALCSARDKIGSSSEHPFRDGNQGARAPPRDFRFLPGERPCGIDLRACRHQRRQARVAPAQRRADHDGHLGAPALLHGEKRRRGTLDAFRRGRARDATRRHAGRATHRRRTRGSAFARSAAQFPLLRQSPEISALRQHLQREMGGREPRLARARQHPSEAAGRTSLRRGHGRRHGARARHARRP